MPSRFVHSLYERDSPHGATARQQALIDFAVKLTSAPQTFTTRDTDAIRRVLPVEGEVVEAATVVAGFNFANRVADTLDVPLEVPRIFRRRRIIRRLAMRVMSFGIRRRMNFKNRELPAEPVDEVLERLGDSTARAGMGKLPSYFERLRVRPHIVAGQAAICMSLLAEPGFARDTVRQIGYLVSTLNHDWECAMEFAAQLNRSGIPLAPIDRIAEDGDFRPATLHEEILALARKITLRADQVSDSEVNSLLKQGISERQVLNLTLLTASYNAGNRLNRALSAESCVRRDMAASLAGSGA